MTKPIEKTVNARIKIDPRYVLGELYERLKEKASEGKYCLSHINSEGRWVGYLKSSPKLVGSTVKFATKEEKRIQEAIEVVMAFCAKCDD